MADLNKCLKELNIAMQYKNKNTRDSVLKYLSLKQCVYNTLREIAKNIEKMNLTSTQRRKLIPHARTLNKLRKGAKSKSTQQLLVQQTGGFLPWLIPIAAAILPTIIDKLT